MNLLKSAKDYVSIGLSVISTDNTKRSIGSWKQYQYNLPTEQQINTMFAHPKVQGLAVICGAVSGNLEVIDVDCKYGVDFTKYCDKILDADPVLFSKLFIVKTKSNGYHIYFKCEHIEGNQKLAERPPNDAELKANPMAKSYELIETRGEGGYVCAPPTPGYNPEPGNKQIPVLTIDERDTLMSCAREFNQIIEEVVQVDLPKVTPNNYKITVWEDYNKRGNILELLTKHGWSLLNNDGKKTFLLRPGSTTSATSAVIFNDTKIFYPHTTSTNFENKGYNPFGVYMMLEAANNLNKACKQLADLGYGEMNGEGLFWTYTKNGVKIKRYDLAIWLSTKEFMIYFQNKKLGLYRIIKKDETKIKESYSQEIKSFIVNHLQDSLKRSNDEYKPKNDLPKNKKLTKKDEDFIEIETFNNDCEALLRESSVIFNDNFYEFLKEAEVDILRDKAKNCYFPFKNGIVTIDNNEIKFINYGDIKECIWDSQINDFDIYVNKDAAINDSEYYRFIELISNEETERVNYAMSIIGYILHSYKDSSRPFAVILAEETDDEAKGGGTGKGIFFKAISKLIPTVTMDGKNFKPDKTFAFSRVELGTKLVVIEDCPKNVEFERYYPTITEGMTIEKKNKDEIFLSFDDSPKLAFTTNYSIASNAEHAKRRQRVLEFSPYFSSSRTPEDVFEHKLFNDWTNDEWQKFYNFLFKCVQYYFKNGIKPIMNSEKLNRKQIKMQFGEDFLDYLDTIIEDHYNQQLPLNDEWKNFLNRYELQARDYSLKRYSKGLQIASQILGIDYIGYKNRQDNNKKYFKIGNNNNTYKEIVTNVTDLF